MDLGLKELSNDHLVDLLESLLAELASRDGIVRQLAQQTVLTAGEKLEAQRVALENALQEVKAEQIAEIEAETLIEIRRLVQYEAARVMSTEEELAAILAADVKAKEIALRELRDSRGANSGFTICVRNGLADVRLDSGRRFQVAVATKPDFLFEHIAALLG